MLRAILNVQKELYGEGNFDAYELASTYSLLGDKQQALNLLEIAVTNHEERDVALRIDQNFLALHVRLPKETRNPEELGRKAGSDVDTADRVGYFWIAGTRLVLLSSASTSAILRFEK